MQESKPVHTSNMQSPLGGRGSHPSRALARELLPAPVGPRMTTRGLARAGGELEQGEEEEACQGPQGCHGDGAHTTHAGFIAT